MGFEGLDKGMKFRDLIARIATGVVEKSRPPYRYGQVKAIDHATRRCDVLFTGDSEPVSVPVGSVFPSFINQVVRVDGIGTDRYIADVIGDAQPNRGELIPNDSNVDDYKYPGLYCVNLNTAALTVLNWPTARAGNLRVTANSTTNMIYQEVTNYSGMRYHREWYNNNWTPWTTDGFMVAASASAEVTLVSHAKPTKTNPLFVHRSDKILTRDSLRMTSDGVIWTEIMTRPSDAKWQTAGLSTTTWSNYGQSYAPFGYLKTSEGIVVLGGLIAAPAGTTGTILVCNLPEGYRPEIKMMFSPSANVGGSQGIGRIDIYPDGRVMAVTYGAGWLSLDGIMFPADGAVTWTDMELVGAFEQYTPDWGVPAYAQDSLGRVWFRGMVKRGSQPTADYAIGLLPTAFDPPNTQLHFLALSSGGASGLDISSKGTTTSHLPNNPSIRFKAGGSVGWINLNGLWYTPKNKQRMSAIGYGNGWASYNSVFPGQSYMVHGDGIVELQGLTNATGSLGLFSGRAPEGARSGGGMRVFATASANMYSRTDVHTGGEIVPLTTQTSWRSLNGIAYMLEN